MKTIFVISVTLLSLFQASCEKIENSTNIPEGMEPDPFSETGYSPKPTEMELQNKFENDLKAQTKQWLFYQRNLYFWMLSEDDAKNSLRQQTTSGETELRKIEYQEAKVKTAEAEAKFDQVKNDFEELVGSGRTASHDFKSIMVAHEKNADKIWGEYCIAITPDEKQQARNDLNEINEKSLNDLIDELINDKH